MKDDLRVNASPYNNKTAVQDINVTIGLENGILNLKSIKEALKFAQAALEGVADLEAAESIEQINIKFNANGKLFEAKIGKGSNGAGINTSFMSYQPKDIDKMSLKDIQQLFSFTTDQPVKDIKRKGIKFANEEIEKSFQHVVPQKEVINAERIQTKASGDIINEVDKPINHSRNTPISVGIAKAEVPEIAPVATGVKVGETDRIRRVSAESQAINTKNPQAQEIHNITNSIAQQQGSYTINVTIADDWIQIENVNTAIREALELIKTKKNDISAKFDINFNTVDTKKIFSAKLEFTDQKMLQEIIDNTDYLYKLTRNWRSEAPEPLPKNLVQNLSFRTSQLLPEGISIAKNVLNLFPEIKQQQEQIISTKPSTKPEVSEANPSLFNRVKSYITENPMKAAAIGVTATVAGVGALAATVVTGGLFAVGAGLAGAAIGAGAYGVVKYNQHKENENIKISKPTESKEGVYMSEGNETKTPEKEKVQSVEVPTHNQHKDNRDINVSKPTESKEGVHMPESKETGVPEKEKAQSAEVPTHQWVNGNKQNLKGSTLHIPEKAENHVQLAESRDESARRR